MGFLIFYISFIHIGQHSASGKTYGILCLEEPMGVMLVLEV